MAESPAGDVSLSIPPLSLAGDKLLMEKVPNSESMPSRLGFPSEFPYEFDSPAFTSPGDTTETEDGSSDDEEDFLAGLTRRLALSTQRLPIPTCSNHKTEEKSRVIVSSPQSTLSGLGSWSASGSGSPIGPSSQVPSPSATPFRKDDAWDVILAAAGQVARLKNNFEPQTPTSLLRLAHVQDLSAHEGKSQSATFWSGQCFQQNCRGHSRQLLGQDGAARQQCYGAWGRRPNYQTTKFQEQMPNSADSVGAENGRYIRAVGTCQPPWLPSSRPHPPSAAVRGVFPGGSVPKRSSAGTGVFLPRRYANPSDSGKKSGTPSVVLPSKIHPQIPNFEEFSGRSQSCFPAALSQYEYECLMARRNAILAQQRSFRRVGGGCLNKEMPPPQDWLY